jgi:CPA1 family monovalent cation:H+ antiporter
VDLDRREEVAAKQEALFRELKAARSLSVLVEGESLFNDGVAAVLYGVLVASAGGKGTSPLVGAGAFLYEFLGPIGVGLAAGWLTFTLTRRLGDHLIEITCSTILAYGSFVLADRLHMSGVTAVIVAGIHYGNHALGGFLAPTSQVMISSSWEYGGFLGNSLVFLLVGSQIDLSRLLSNAGREVEVYLFVLLARALAIVFLSPLLGRDWKASDGSLVGRPARQHRWALALALPQPARDELLPLTSSVVLLSLFVQGLTMKPLLKQLGLVESRPQAAKEPATERGGR